MHYQGKLSVIAEVRFAHKDTVASAKSEFHLLQRKNALELVKQISEVREANPSKQ